MKTRPRLVLRHVGFALAFAPTWVEQARAADGEGHDPIARLLITFLTLFGAAAVHWLLHRFELRIPALIGRRLAPSSSPEAGRLRDTWHRRIALLLLPVKIALWGTAAYFVSEQSRILRAIRAQLLLVIDLSLSAPLFTLNERQYSAWDLLLLPVVFAVLWMLASALTQLLRATVLRSAGLDRGAEETAAILIRYPLVFIGAMVMLQVWGIDMRSLAVLAGVLGVGIGFGLQNLANNFVSGLVLNLERPIRPGDFINLGELTGTVERIGARCTMIRTLDQLTILVPNSRLLEHEVINWSHGDPLSRLHLRVGVAYGSETRRVRRALLDAARDHPNVLRDPRPQVQFKGFGESTLDFELLVWTRDPRNQQDLQSDLNYRIEESLRRHRIEIAFPQRDLHLRSPQLDGLLAAWGRRTFSEEELAAQAPGAAPPADTVDQAVTQHEDESRVRSLSDKDLGELVRRMREADGVGICDRRHLLTVHPKCFVGREAIEWMTRSLGLTHSEALRLGQMLVDQGLVHHVLDEHGFEDANLFYRFYVDEK